MTPPKTNLFTPHTLQGIQLRNRFVRSATLEAMCDLDGHPKESLIDCYRQLAAGGCGLLISGFTYVAQSGKLFPTGLGAASDEHLAGLKKIAAAVHQEGGAFFCSWLMQAGRGAKGSVASNPWPLQRSSLNSIPENHKR